jgi:DegV family protein with EDD domain
VSASNQLAVVADTTSYLPAELVEQNDVHLISLYVGLEGEHQREAEIPDLDAFYERLRVSDEMVTTSQPSVGDFLSVYEPLLAEGREIVSIHLSAGISGTFESAMQARERLASDGKDAERVHLLDSKAACGGMALVILAAAAVARAGGSAADAIAAAERVREGREVWFAVDTLEYLRRGGRIGLASAWLGSALRIKPILTLEEVITPIERVRTRARVFDRLVEFSREQHAAGADAWVVQYIQDREAADRLIDANREIYGCEPLFVSEIGPVIGAHVGPGLLGTGGVAPGLLEP